MPRRGRHVKILLIRLRLIGDVVFTTPLIAALKRTFPASRLTYLVEREAAPVVAGNPHLTQVMVITRTRGWARLRDDLRLARRLRAERFDAVLDLHGGPRSSWLTWATRAPQRIGYDIQGRGWQVHAHRAPAPRPAATPFGRQSMGAAVSARRMARHAARSNRTPGGNGT